MKQQAISKIFTTAKHSQSARTADFQIDEIAGLSGKQVHGSDKSTAAGPKIKVVVKDSTESSTKQKGSKIKVGAKRAAPKALSFNDDGSERDEVPDLPVHKPISKKRKLKGKSSKLAKFESEIVQPLDSPDNADSKTLKLNDGSVVRIPVVLPKSKPPVSAQSLDIVAKTLAGMKKDTEPKPAAPKEMLSEETQKLIKKMAAKKQGKATPTLN